MQWLATDFANERRWKKAASRKVIIYTYIVYLYWHIHLGMYVCMYACIGTYIHVYLRTYIYIIYMHA